MHGRRMTPILISMVSTLLAFGAFSFAEGKKSLTPLAPEKAKLLRPLPTDDNAAEICYEITPPKNLKIESVVVQLPKDRSASYFFMNMNAFNGKDGFWLSTFSCYPHFTKYGSKGVENYLCMGDDDSGRFSLKVFKESAALEILNVSFGNSDEDGPQLHAVKLKGVAVSCNRPTAQPPARAVKAQKSLR